jgi:hypothetical protein
MVVARLFRLPEAYWPPIAALVITQSALGTALAVAGLDSHSRLVLFMATPRVIARVQKAALPPNAIATWLLP